MATGRIGVTPNLRTRWSKAPAGGTTSLSGLDDNSVSLVYDAGFEAVYRNGVLLSRGNDYTATNGTTITLIDATIAGDIIEVFANQAIPLTSTYTQAVADAKFINNSLVDAKGDIIVATAADTVTRLAVGADHSFLKSLATATNGVEWTDTWTSYTPSWSSDGTQPTLGNSSIVGYYQRVGKLCAFYMGFNRGSTATNGTGSYNWTVPFNFNNSRYNYPTGIGTFYLEDYSVTGYMGFITTAGTNKILCRAHSNNVIGATNPFTWGTNDYIWLSGVYEVE